MIETFIFFVILFLCGVMVIPVFNLDKQRKYQESKKYSRGRYSMVYDPVDFDYEDNDDLDEDLDKFENLITKYQLALDKKVKSKTYYVKEDNFLGFYFSGEEILENKHVGKLVEIAHWCGKSNLDFVYYEKTVVQKQKLKDIVSPQETNILLKFNAIENTITSQCRYYGFKFTDERGVLAAKLAWG